MSPPFYGVIDGATAKSEHAGESPGRRLARGIAAAGPGLAPDADAHTMVEQFTEVARQLATGHSETPSASVVMYAAHRNEVWAVGDGWLQVDDEVRCFEHEIEKRSAALRAAYLYAALEARPASELIQDDRGRAMILPMLRSEGTLANLDRPHPLCWGRIDGRAVPDRFIRVIPLPMAWTRLVLASDGYSALGESFEASEALQMARVRRDPLMIEDPPATKGVAPGQVNHDDRTWLELRREP